MEEFAMEGELEQFVRGQIVKGETYMKMAYMLGIEDEKKRVRNIGVPVPKDSPTPVA